MIIRNNEREISVRESMRQGPGSVELKSIVSKEEMYDKARLYTTMTLKQNCGVGYHTHENEEEIFVINHGKGIYNDNGNEIEVYPGDVLICKENEGHAITNKEPEDLLVTALIILK